MRALEGEMIEKYLDLLKRFLFIFSLSLIFILSVHSAARAADEIKLDADRISYDESTGIATAEGNVNVSNEEVRLVAPYVEYDSLNQKVRALSTRDGTVTFTSAGKRINCERVDYDIVSRKGVMTSPNGKADAFYVKGRTIEVMPVSSIRGEKIKSGQNDDMAAVWTGAVVTTCNHTDPHYRLEAKDLTVIPGKRIIIKKPRVYFGNTLLFTYPFDYVVPIGDRSKFDRQYIFPKIGYESDKGVGIGISGPIMWDTGALNMEVVWWSDDIWEGEALLTQQIAEGLTAYGSVARKFDVDRDANEWRPSWGVQYERKGWTFDVGWSQRELVTLEKMAGEDSRYIVWRKPETNIISPWFDDAAAAGQFRLFASWGKYEDATSGGAGPETERIGAGIQLRGEFGGERTGFRPFYNALYWYYRYDDDILDSQQLLDAVFGIRWELSSIDMETAYLRRWKWGSSPMAWDDYAQREEIYQQLSVKIPTKSQELWWELSMRGAYSIESDELAEMAYKAIYNQHCLRWELIYRDDRRGGNDDWVGLKLVINAYPESGIRLAGEDLFEPSSAPDKLVPNLNHASLSR
jgi:LPS-assembly protein